ncbi:hypothetical protein F6B41_23465 [Microbacterium lushaniae]|nr:hypothetical protein F6B41_23465 [Microbacterium lushaniae]
MRAAARQRRPVVRREVERGLVPDEVLVLAQEALALEVAAEIEEGAPLEAVGLPPWAGQAELLVAVGLPPLGREPEERQRVL